MSPRRGPIFCIPTWISTPGIPRTTSRKSYSNNQQPIVQDLFWHTASSTNSCSSPNRPLPPSVRSPFIILLHPPSSVYSSSPSIFSSNCIAVYVDALPLRAKIDLNDTISAIHQDLSLSLQSNLKQDSMSTTKKLIPGGHSLPSRNYYGPEFLSSSSWLQWDGSSRLQARSLPLMLASAASTSTQARLPQQTSARNGKTQDKYTPWHDHDESGLSPSTADVDATGGRLDLDDGKWKWTHQRSLRRGLQVDMAAIGSTSQPRYAFEVFLFNLLYRRF